MKRIRNTAFFNYIVSSFRRFNSLEEEEGDLHYEVAEEDLDAEDLNTEDNLIIDIEQPTEGQFFFYCVAIFLFQYT